MIGILAGMGPRSTTPFLELVLDYCNRIYGARYDEEFPKMVIISLPTPFYIDKPINHKKMKEVIISGLKQLENNNVKFIVMPCNSAHIYFNELSSAINIPLLNIVDETLYNINDNEKTTILATKQTMESNLYQKGLQEKGIDYLFDPRWQQNVDTIIKNIKAGNIKEAENIRNDLYREIKQNGIKRIIIACTDLNVILKKSELDPEILDSSEELAKSTVNNYLKYAEEK